MRFLYMTAATLALTAPAFAQCDFNAGATPDENVVVSATRIATPISQIGSSVTVVTANQIEARQDRDLPSAL